MTLPDDVREEMRQFRLRNRFTALAVAHICRITPSLWERLEKGDPIRSQPRTLLKILYMLREGGPVPEPIERDGGFWLENGDPYPHQTKVSLMGEHLLTPCR